MESFISILLDFQNSFLILSCLLGLLIVLIVLILREKQGRKEVRKAMSEKEKKEIAEMVETAKHLATHDPQAFMIAKSNMEILKIRADMDKQEKEPA